MGFTKQDFDNDEKDSKPVEIPKDFYEADFKECNAYTKDDERRLALIFEVEYEDEVVEVGRFLSAKATTYSDELKQESDVSDSHLGSLFDRLGLLESLENELSSRLAALDWFDGEVPEGFLTSEEGGYSASDDNEHELLADSVDALFDGHKFKVLVVTPGGDGGSLVEDVDPVDGYDYTVAADEDQDTSTVSGESSSSDDESGEDGEDVIFDDEDDDDDEDDETGKE